MKEYWVNVYDNNSLGAICVNRTIAENLKTHMNLSGEKVIYRLHIKIKYPEFYPQYRPQYAKLFNGNCMDT